MRRTAVAAFVAVVLAAGCTRQVAGPEVTPTATTASSIAPVRAPVGRAVEAPEPIKDKFLLYNQLYKSGQVAAVDCSLPTATLANKQAMIRGERLDHYGHPGYDRGTAHSVNFDRWLRQAFKAKGPSGCNTWVAPAGSVS